MPVATNCCVEPATTDGFEGVTAIDERVAAVTVIERLPLTEPTVAETLDVPVSTAVTTPALLTVATEVVAEAQVALDVRSCVELSV